VIFVSVREDEGLDVVAKRLEGGEIRDHEVDAEQFRLRKHDAGIHEESGLPAGDEQHVHAELAETAERDHVKHQFPTHKPAPVGSGGNRSDEGSRHAARSGHWESLK